MWRIRKILAHATFAWQYPLGQPSHKGGTSFFFWRSPNHTAGLLNLAWILNVWLFELFYSLATFSPLSFAKKGRGVRLSFSWEVAEIKRGDVCLLVCITGDRFGEHLFTNYIVEATY